MLQLLIHSYLEPGLHFRAAVAKCHFQRFRVFQDFLEESSSEFGSVSEIRWHSDLDKAKLILHVMQKGLL